MSKRVLFFILLFAQSVARAELNLIGNIFVSYTGSGVVDDSAANPGNRGAAVPDSLLIMEIRPEFHYRTESSLEFVLRSRHLGSYHETRLAGPDEHRSGVDGDSDLSDAFLGWGVTDTLSTTIGLQNYQWGPAEIASPSNVFFHFNNDQRSYYYKEKGRVLARVNWTPRPDWSFILIYEPMDNRQPNWVYDREFKPQSAFKIEKQFENPANSVALVAGNMEGRSDYVGEHFNWSPVEGYSLYADLRHQRNETHYKPVAALGNFVHLTDTQAAEGNWATLAVVGFRFEGRTDFRQEFIYNQSGYDKDQWTQVNRSVTELSPYLLSNLSAFSQPGLELRSRSYSYTSIRIPDLGPRDTISVSARVLASLIQDSGALQLNYEQNLNDEMVLSAETTNFFGQKNTEFRLLKDHQYSIGLKYSF
ncbi:MAG: hypothetical protein KF789_11570 [Bdellovibrionaceae bacterium]|nr:hypothetical protein [Pseudobdellovibrionaceae bacterium]